MQDLAGLAARLFLHMVELGGRTEAERLWKRAMTRKRGRPPGKSKYHREHLAVLIHGLRPLAAMLGWTKDEYFRFLIANFILGHEMGANLILKSGKETVSALMKELQRAEKISLPTTTMHGEPTVQHGPHRAVAVIRLGLPDTRDKK